MVTAIAGKIGKISGEMRILLYSFHRGRQKTVQVFQTGIPDIPLVLLQLTKPPFKILKDASH